MIQSEAKTPTKKPKKPNEKLELKAEAVKKKKPKTQTSIYWFDTEKGFGLRVSPKGAKTLFIQEKIKVGSNWETIKKTIGKCDDRLTAANFKEMHKKARKLLDQIRDGIDIRTSVDTSTNNTLGHLMNGYIDYLKTENKPSARSVESAITKNIETAFPKLWQKPAKEITIDDCVSIIGNLNDEGKHRQADKLRSYIKAAYSRAINARGNVKASKVLRDLRLTQNPARDIHKIEGSSQAKERSLSLNEFRSYWSRIKELPEPNRSVTMLHVITGGQRQQQLARVTLSDIDRDGLTMRIYDGKGRRQKPRVHIVPLLPQALELIDNITGAGQYVFSSNGGISPMDLNFINRTAKKICADMAKNKELEGTPFTAGTIRATIETRLMQRPYRISSDVLARLLSHGLGGVQAKHYAHDSMHDEQLEALNKLWSMVENEELPSAEVIQFDKEARA